MNPKLYVVVMVVLFASTILNLVFLNYRVFVSPIASTPPPSPTVKPTPPPLPTTIPTVTKVPDKTEATASAGCSAACQQFVKGETDRLEKLIDTKIDAKIAALLQSTQSSTVKEYDVFLGTGTTTSDAWQNLTGTDTTINPADYGNFRTAYFEAVIYIPTKNGRVSAQLYNLTDNTVVANSYIATESGTPTKVVSPQITLPTGNKTYRVQLVSSLKYEAKMDFARVRILVQ